MQAHQEYLQYEIELYEQTALSKERWTNYPEKNTMFSGEGYIRSAMAESQAFFLEIEAIHDLPWVAQLFIQQNLAALGATRREFGMTTSYVDYFGPGHFRLLDPVLPDESLVINAQDKEQIALHRKYNPPNITVVDTNLFDVRNAQPVIASAIGSGLGRFHLSTSTPQGPFWRYMDQRLKTEFPRGIVWWNFGMMFVEAYAYASNNGGVMLFQIPVIDSKSDENDAHFVHPFVARLNHMGVPTISTGPMLVSVKLPSSPALLSVHSLKEV